MNQILLVEGKDDLFVFSNIFEKHKVVQSFEIEDKKGIENIFKSIPIYVKTDVLSIGIVIDADVTIQDRWNSLRSILTQIGYKVPNNPIKQGTLIKEEGLPNFGIWIMPNNDKNGMLEDFVKYLIPKNDELMPVVENTLQVLEDKELSKYKRIHKSKAKIHTWLAWQESPGTPMGLAINQKYLETDNEMCETFVKWINQLYN